MSNWLSTIPLGTIIGKLNVVFTTRVNFHISDRHRLNEWVDHKSRLLGLKWRSLTALVFGSYSEEIFMAFRSMSLDHSLCTFG